MLENAALIAVGSFAVLILAYFTYGRFVARYLYRLDPNRITPAHVLRDEVDYVPTRIPVLFGHHFASIAGLGPDLGSGNCRDLGLGAGRAVGVGRIHFYRGPYTTWGR